MLFQSVGFTTHKILYRIQVTLCFTIIIKHNTISRGFIIPSVYFTFNIISFFYVFFIYHIGVFCISLPIILLYI